jgi:protein arginine kinase
LRRYASRGEAPLRSSLFVLSNERTLGKREEEILEELRELTVDIVAREQKAISKLRQGGGSSLEDKLWRSFGMMRYARYVDFEEALFHLSLLRMGMSFGGLPAISHGDWKRLLLHIHPMHIRAWSSERGIPAGEHEVRAYRIRQALKNTESPKNRQEKA